MTNRSLLLAALVALHLVQGGGGAKGGKIASESTAQNPLTCDVSIVDGNLGWLCGAPSRSPGISLLASPESTEVRLSMRDGFRQRPANLTRPFRIAGFERREACCPHRLAACRRHGVQICWLRRQLLGTSLFGRPGCFQHEQSLDCGAQRLALRAVPQRGVLGEFSEVLAA